MGKQRGRPAKYQALLDRLDDDQVYTASMIANVPVIDYDDAALDRDQHQQWIRIAMNRLPQSKEFPVEPELTMECPSFLY